MLLFCCLSRVEAVFFGGGDNETGARETLGAWELLQFRVRPRTDLQFCYKNSRNELHVRPTGHSTPQVRAFAAARGGGGGTGGKGRNQPILNPQPNTPCDLSGASKRSWDLLALEAVFVMICFVRGSPMINVDA